MKGKPWWVGILFLVSFVLLSLLLACTTPGEAPSPPAETAAFPMELTDQAGRAVRIEKMPEKIISLAPGNTEILYALGLEDRLVGVTTYCNYPEAAKDKPQIGQFSKVDTEIIVQIQPDLILAANIHKDEVVPELERIGLTVLTLNPRTMDEVIEAINLIGRATANEDEASQLVAEMKQRIKSITDKTASLTKAQMPRVFYVLWHDPLRTVDAETRIHELIVKAGGINIAENLEGDYPTISLEAVIMANPQVIIAGSGHGAGANLPYEFAITESRLREVAARQNNRVYKIDTDLTSRPGPRIVDGLEELAKMIHPEIFGSD